MEQSNVMMEKRQLFLRSYQFCRKKSMELQLPEKKICSSCKPQLPPPPPPPPPSQLFLQLLSKLLACESYAGLVSSVEGKPFPWSK
ncbi:hypothetical protein Pint_21887 [Pistacia integerrima]|uniref:Uncharacterized protein n=1 Tax=Pistacia integerrima TaxID=434235 RepID=A0ACC0X7X4_9ROSI|nr:hypothetical protein Pint_21887 [Pistacia integerrima]